MTTSATPFLAGPDVLSRLSVPLLPSGVVAGRDDRAALVSAQLFAPTPSQVSLVGTWWCLGLMIFRSLAVGARVFMSTTAGDYWNEFGRTATGREDRLHAVAGPIDLPAGTAAEPVLHVVDVAQPGGPAISGPPPGRWQTRLSAIPRVTLASVPDLSASRLALVQRLVADEVTVAAASLKVPRADMLITEQLNDDMVALVTGGTVKPLWMVPTTVESQTFGPAPARG